MRTESTDRAIRPDHLAAEQASWMVVVAAETLAGRQEDPSERVRYAEAGRRMLHAARRPRSDPRSLREASPKVADPGGGAYPLIEMLASYGDDPDAGVRAAMAIFSMLDWWPTP